MNEIALDGDQLATLQAAGDTTHSPLSPTPFLLCDLERVDRRGAEPLAAWLRQQPCPVIGIGGDEGQPLAHICDVHVVDARAAQAVIAGARRNPLAAAVLVQLLRMIELLSVDDALVAESMAYATLQGGAEFRAWLATNRADSPAAINDDGPAVLLDRDGDTLRLTLNRPGNRNGMSVEMRDALCEALQLAVADESLTSIRIDARGKCFSTGGDVTEFGSAPDTATAHAVRSVALPGRLLLRCAARTSVEVHGACVGSGIEFPSFAGRIEARPDAWFQLPELKYGLIPGAGGCVGVARRIGRQRVAWMVLSGARINARTALEWGLVDALLDAR